MKNTLDHPASSTGIVLAIFSMFLVFPSLDGKAVTDYRDYYKYANS